MPAIAPVRLDESQFEAAANVLDRAFIDDPPLVYAVPDRRRRAPIVRAFFGSLLRYTLGHGEVWTTPGTVDGLVCWLLSPNSAASDEDVAAAGMDDAFAMCAPDEAKRLAQVFAFVEAIHARVADRPHHYLFIIGVDEGKQGVGIGSAVLQPVLQRADREGMLCIVETMNAQNVPFYERNGFVVVDEDVLPGSDVRIWAFRREPHR